MNKWNLDLTGAKVLIVDDVPANLDVLSQSLDDSGYNVLVATSGEIALKVAAQTGPDLILLDVMMPGIDGFETCRRLKANPELQDTPVLFLTARDELSGVLEGFQVGGLDYITKPFQKEEVLIRIRTHLERTRLAQELAKKNHELADLNAHLEQKVEERTVELRQKVKELEGKDRIAQHLLTLHSLQETLELVLEVIADITEVDRAVIYLDTEDGLKSAAAIGRSAPGAEQTVSPAHQQAISAVRERLEPVNITAPEDPDVRPFVLMPILRGETLLGLIHVDQRQPVTDDLMHTLTSFALQAAVAINDAQVQQDTSRWESQIEEVLDVDDIVLEDLEPFENPDSAPGASH